MNQILAIDNSDRGKEYKSKQKKSRGPVEISKILKFFSIILIVYGVLMIGTGSYSMYKNSQGSSSTKATIYMSEPIGTEITINADSYTLINENRLNLDVKFLIHQVRKQGMKEIK